MLCRVCVLWFRSLPAALRSFKYFNVIPQMGMLIKVLSNASGPVLIFTTVSLVPCFGIALSYHVTYGQRLAEYSTIGSSLNTVRSSSSAYRSVGNVALTWWPAQVMRLSVGDFDFDQIYQIRTSCRHLCSCITSP